MSIDQKKLTFFQAKILDWFKLNGRSFPWRAKSASNYIRIISEVLLQRTKAETVANYFPKFIEIYPSWRRLGEASQVDLEIALKPLGLHKQRAARLFRLAQDMKNRKGRFPSNPKKVSEMAMMGQYITNAYELFVLNKPSPLLDVNMARVLERFFEPRKLADIRYDPYLQNLARRIIEETQYPKKLNWAILDFASRICKARMPRCSECVLSSLCSYYYVNYVNIH